MFDENQNWILLLDLEGTLIESWNEPDWIPNGDKVCKFLTGSWLGEPSGYKGRIGLMSWAVENEQDKQKFNKFLRPIIEEQFHEFKFDDELVLSMQDWAALVFEATKCKVSIDDLFDVCKKEDVLFKLRKHPMFHHACVTLLDDAVAKSEYIECQDNKSKFIIRNIGNLFD
jgi:hypothetical protein